MNGAAASPAMLSRKTGTCCGFFSLLVAAFSVLVLLEFDDFYRDILNKQVSITEGSSAFRMWKDVSSGFDMSANLYFFNITNVEQVKQGRANPRLREMGPYAYRMEWVKDNITFNDNGTVSFLEKIIFHFDSENSVGSEDDLVTTVNVPYVAALHLLNGQNVLVRILGRPVLSKLSQGLYLTRSVRQLSFEGYPDVLMMLAAAAQKKNSAAGSSSSSAGFDIASVLRSAHRTQVDALKNQPESEVGRFSYMTGRNDTFHELLTMFTGEGNISQINYLDSIDGKRKLNTWSGDLCDELRGSFGNVRTPLSPPSPETVFIPDLKRAFTLHHVADTKVSSLSTRRYALTSDSFDPASPEHSCYNAARSYLPAGVADLGPLQEGAPIVLSLPHFLHGSSSLFTGVEGLYPDKDRHLFYIDSEPITGAAVSARVRLQLNVLLDQVPNFWSSSELGYTVLPLFWQEVVAEAQGHTVTRVRMAVLAPMLVRCAAIFLLVSCTILVLVALVSLLRSRKSRRRTVSEPSKGPKEKMCLYLNGASFVGMRDNNNGHTKNGSLPRAALADDDVPESDALLVVQATVV